MFTPQGFKSMFGHFTTCMKGVNLSLIAPKVLQKPLQRVIPTHFVKIFKKGVVFVLHCSEYGDLRTTCIHPVNIYLFRKTCEIYSKLPIKTPERHPCVYIVNCKYILHFFLVFIVNFEHTFVCWAIWVRKNRDKENSIFGRFYTFFSGGQAQRVKGT